jgi:hypothetical protein
MDKHDAVIFITPNIGEHHNRNIFLRNLNQEEINFMLEDIIIEYRKEHNSYSECLSDIKNKMKKIKKILEE